MATMVKEKRREKKKSKDKASKAVSITETPTLANMPQPVVEERISASTLQGVVALESADSIEPPTHNLELSQDQAGQSETKPDSFNMSANMENIEASDALLLAKDSEQVYLSDVSLGSEANESIQRNEMSDPLNLENISPSAPMLEEEQPHIKPVHEITVVNEVIRLKSMPLEEAVRLFAGTEMAMVMAMSEKEEAAVDAGPVSGPEHPLVDLLSTFRRSLIAVERERMQMEVGYAEEEKFRSTLWKVTKKSVQAAEKCPCGLNIHYKATYDHAEFQKERLPIARLKLEGLLKDCQESFCHNQHETLLAHYQIEEFISEIVKSHKGEIREALTLVLQALKLCDSAPAALGAALERWARALAAALVDQRDVRQILFLIHHLFRQTRSVRWAASVVTVTVTDCVSAARAVALMDLLFARTTVDAAVECVEEKDDTWEEVDKDGGGGAVTDGSLRERDLLAILAALPVRDLVATILRLRPVVGQPRSYKFEETDGRGVIRACCGARALLHVLSRSLTAHARYTRLSRALRRIAGSVMNALAALHEHASGSYPCELESKVFGELQGVFVSGLQVMDGVMADVPASLLAAHAARDYCIANMTAVDTHTDDGVVRVECLSLDLPVARCGTRVRAIAHAAISRRHDYELARLVLEFLFRIGVKKIATTPVCKGGCRQAARECLPAVLGAHPYLHALALHLVADTNPVEKLDAASVECLCISSWRPACGEARALAAAWAQRCPHLLPALLVQMDCEPHKGVSLESQLTIGTWLCEYVSSVPEAEEWCWMSLRRLRLHPVHWGLAVEAPPPDPRPPDLFGQAFALAASSWGHSIPMICSEGVEALCSLAASRVQDALHCLSPIMLVLAHSPESVSTTPRFNDLFTSLINAGPGLMQRALGRSGTTGADCLLRLMMEQLKREHCGDVSREEIARVWLAALWRVPGANVLLDTAMMNVSHGPLDRHTIGLAEAQDEDSQQLLLSATKWSTQAPLLCESALRSWHSSREMRTRTFPRLLDALHAQRTRAHRIHVDNALKSLGVSLSSDQLTIYSAASGVLTAPPSHPAHVPLWRLWMHLYLHRAPSGGTDSPPVGPLFFSGLIKSRSLTQIKRRLLRVIQHHGAEATALKSKQNKSETEPSRPQKSRSKTVDNSLTVPLSIRDLTGESSDSSDIDSDTSDGKKNDSEPEEGIDDCADVPQLLKYHIGAERMFCEYLRWLDEGEKTKAMPHHAEIANFISEQALQAALHSEAGRRWPAVSPECAPPPLPPDAVPSPAPPPPCPLDDATRAVLAITRLKRRSRRQSIRSPLHDVDCRDARAMLALVDKHLADIQKLSQDWCKEVGRVESLDAALWPLVSGLRAPRPIPALAASCANKCSPVSHTPQAQQWCISSGAEQGIKDNRVSARSAVRQLARPRANAARAAAVLLAVARRCGSCEMARRVCERVFQCAGTVSKQCAPAAAALVAVIELIAERWLLSDGSCCAALVSRWGGAKSSELQRALCLCVVAPTRSAAANVPALHAALLAAALPPHMMFSALSKFDLSRWSRSVESPSRSALLESVTAAAQRWGPAPTTDDMLIVELLGVQMSAVCHATELCVLVRACTRACVDRKLPPPVLDHVVRTTDKYAAELPYDQLGHMLRELGSTWWEARNKLSEATAGCYSVYARQTIALLLAIHTAFYQAAVALSYTPEKVGVVSWASLQEALSPWLSPAGAALPPALHSDYAAALQHVLGHILYYYADILPVLLNQIFEWVVQMFQLSHGSPQGRLQLSVLLAACAELPWDKHQWLLPSGLQVLLQVSQCSDEEMLLWCGRCCEGLEAAAWLRGDSGSPAARLAALLFLWTGTAMPCSMRTVETLCRLPWQRLPEAALDEALDRFFQNNYSLATPHHSLPQFKILVAACELIPIEGTMSCGTLSHQKRARGVSRYTRELHEHRTPAAGAEAIADILADLAPQLLRSPGGEEELVELIGRALAIFCIEPAAAAAAPVWERFTSSCDATMSRAILRAVGGLTAFEYFACIADIAVKTYLAQGGDWWSIARVWRACVWREAGALCGIGRAHAAYAAHAAADNTPLRASFNALLDKDIHTKNNEAIISVWICVACRFARCCGDQGEQAECKHAALKLLSRWGEAPRGLLRLVMNTTTGPTPQHRLLCLFAQCILNPNNDSAVRAYESACAGVSGLSPDVVTWGRNPHPRRLPRLAMRLYPNEERYFQRELELTPEDG